MNIEQRRAILKIRYELDVETLSILKDENLRDDYMTLQEEYEKCSTTQMLEQIEDILLDSFGS